MVTKARHQLTLLPKSALARRGKSQNRLATLRESAAWQCLPRAVQRSYEVNENRNTALVWIKEGHGDAVDALRSESLAGILTSIREWQEAIAELGDAISEDEREALTLAKSNELAALLTGHQTGLDSLNALLEADLQDLLTRPRHEWTEQTLEDKLENLWTFGEAELARRGYPPLSFGESVLNTITFGLVADKRLRDYERERYAAAEPARTEVLADEEGIIDVDFAPR